VNAIKIRRNERQAAAGFFEEYRSSLKPPETEELINIYFYRPLAFVLAKAIRKLGVGPNGATFISMCFGVSSGFFFSKGTSQASCIAATLLALMILFDCADGQLARMLGKSSHLGKTFDGIADVMTHFSIFYGTASAQWAQSRSFYPFVLAFMAQVSMYIHIMFYDHFKNAYISIAYPGYQDRLESIDKLRERAKERKDFAGRLLLTLHNGFYRFETVIVSVAYPPQIGYLLKILPDPERIDSYARELLRNQMRPSVRLWSFLGDTIHLALFIAFGFAGTLFLVFPVIVLLMNLYMFAVVVYQRTKLKQFALERELLWQERFD